MPTESTDGLKDGETPYDRTPPPALWDVAQVDAYSAIQAYLDHNSDESGGVSAIGSDHLVVHLLDGPTPGAELGALVDDVKAAGSTVEFDRVQRSLAELLKLQSFGTPEGACSSPLFAGTRVVTCGIQPDTNSVEVSVAELTPELVARVSTEFGDAVTVIQGDDDEMTVAAGRLNDTAPFYGGNALGYVANGFVNHFSGGFAMKDSGGTKFLMTAGHAFDVGTTGQPVYTANSAAPSSNPATVNSLSVGTQLFTQYTGNCSTGCFDGTILWGATYAPRIWIGGPSSTTSQSVIGDTAPPAGVGVLVGGARTGQKLGTTTGTPFCATDSLGNPSCGQMRVNAASGQAPLCRDGDSGGPVFGPDGVGHVIGVGLITSCNASGSAAYYVQVSSLLYNWSSSILTP